MPASSSSDVRLSEEAVRATVVRLSRHDGEGGATVERAAILAEGTPAAAIEAWILDNGGEPEALKVRAPRPGLYGLRPDMPAAGAPGHSPRRYVLPAAALGATR